MIRQTQRTTDLLYTLKSEGARLTTAHLALLVKAPVPSTRRLLNSLMRQGAPIARIRGYWVPAIAPVTGDASAVVGN